MKNSFVILLSAIILCLVFGACAQTDTPDGSTDPTDKISQTTELSTDSVTDLQTEITAENTTGITDEPTTLSSEPVGGSDDDYFGVRKYKYRYNYYRITSHYKNIVGVEAYYEWFNSNPDFASKNLDEMLMVSYIKHFNITREQFDEASRQRQEFYEEHGNTLLEYPFENDGVYSYDDEGDEIYNADIIYTFDNDIINEYYARPPELIIENGTNALGEAVE